jgi:catechol 2,3-dioxygenase
MMGLRKVTCAELRVSDLKEAVAFHRDVLGLVELGTDAGRVFMSCQDADGPTDLVLAEGGTGVAAFSIGVDEGDDLDAYASHLRDVGIGSELRWDLGPSRAVALVFKLPWGPVVELSPEPRKSAQEQDRQPWTASRGMALAGIDHITLGFHETAGAQDTVRVLTHGLGFAVSDVVVESNDRWLGAWTRLGALHHDVGLLRCQAGANLHHLAWTTRNADHLSHAADCLAGAGYGLEAGIGRHGVGGNLYSYFWAAGGNRYELSAEMPSLADDSTAPTVRRVGSFNSFSAWGIHRPESFTRGS